MLNTRSDSRILAPEMVRELVRRLSETEKFRGLLAPDRRRLLVGGLRGSSYVLLVAALAESGRDVLLILPTPEEADQASEDVALFLGRAPTLFPAWDVFPPEQKVPGVPMSQRLRVLCRVLDVASPHAEPARAAADTTGSGPAAASRPAAEPVLPTDRADIREPESQVVLAPIQALLQPVWPEEVLRARLMVLRRGERLSVEGLAARLVDAGFERVPQVELPGEFSVRGGIVDIFAPSSTMAYRIELLDDAIESIRVFSTETQRSLGETEACQIVALNDPVLGMEGRRVLLHFLPRDWLILLREPALIQENAERCREDPAAARLLVDFREVYRQTLEFPQIELHAEPVMDVLAPTNFTVASPPGFAGAADRIAEELVGLLDESDLVIVLSNNPAEEARLKEILRPAGILEREGLVFEIGYLSRGFRFREIRTACLTQNEIFNRYRTRRPAGLARSEPIQTAYELRKGDYVVHVGHGIGRFRGIETLERGNRTEEFLAIEYAGKTKLYVPASQIELVHRYISGTRVRPALSKLGTTAWERRKAKVREAVKEYALELLELQALRSKLPGIAHPPDTEWQAEFERSFPYEETEDQLRAVEEIKLDLERSVPADRLLCGDVGFGKTEVCMRAAFKVVLGGRQVAVLVPTTVLAEQHCNTFRERMSAYPIRIEMLSRFRTKLDQKRIIAALKAGALDIVIGTHRLLSKDVGFKNLGLVIVDEEQRFGVKAKEKLKKLRYSVDVLTLTATPIPRTLHMSLTGLRDVSVLATPPQDRLAIVTDVCRFDLGIIREGILRELRRGGQVFFVHNRIQDLEQVATLLRQAVPEATFTVVHGQMKPDLLERRMARFVRGEVDVLVSTNIIESGLDIRRANTIFIDRADTFGLADLHQLRGRVGRYKHRAYAYFLLPANKLVTGKALRRLRAVEEFSELGSGFQLAMRDLEIRGAGNILGVEQHGHIAQIGYELYCRLLESAVKELAHEETPQFPETEFSLPVSAYVPSTYVSDIQLKIEIYRKCAAATSLDALYNLEAECEDRYGKPPEEVRNLFRQHRLRILLQPLKIVRVNWKDDHFELRFLDPTALPLGLIERCTMTAGGILRVPVPKKLEPQQAVEFLGDALERLLRASPAEPPGGRT